MTKSKIKYPVIKEIYSPEDCLLINKKNLVAIDYCSIIVKESLNREICIKRTGGNLKERAVYLPPNYDYSIVKDDYDNLCLIILRK